MAGYTRLTTRFFDRGMELLANHGYAGLKLSPLCSAVEVSTGAFYHSFTNWRDYTTQLLEYWKTERTTRLVEIATSAASPTEQLSALLLMASELPHRAEAAIRVWSLTDPEVAEIQQVVDQERYDVIHRAFVSLVNEPELAEHYSRAGMYLLIGYEQAESFQHRASLKWSLGLLLTDAARH